MRRIKTGVYCITCLVNQKVYVGQTGNIHRRWGNHRYDLRYGVHKNKYLQTEWDLYGEDKFSFNILEECSRTDLQAKEKEWIDKYDSAKVLKGFNYLLDISREKQEESNIPSGNRKGKQVEVYKGEEFMGTYESVIECAKQMNINKRRIQEVCLGKRYGTPWKKEQYKGYIFKYK